MAIETLIWLIPLPPLLAFFLIVLFTNKSKALSHWIAVGSAGLSWLGAMVVFFTALNKPHLAEEPLASTIRWIPMPEAHTTPLWSPLACASGS